MRTVLSLLLLLIISISNAQQIRIGVIADLEESEGRVSIFANTLKAEIQRTVGSGFDVLLMPEDILAIGWDENKAIEKYNQLSQRCDLLISMGVLTTKAILKNGTPKIPTLGVGISNVELQSIPITASGTSGIENFSYILTSTDVENEVSEFRALSDFKNLALIVHEKRPLTVDFEEIKVEIARLSEKFQIEMNIVLVNDDIDQSLEKLPEETDAAMVVSVYEFDSNQIKSIADNLIERKLPSYSLRRDYVELGILASVSADNDEESIIRTLSIMIDDIQQGASPADLPVNLDIKKQLYFNAGTSTKIEFSPSFQTLFTANIIGDQLTSNVPSYSLTQIIQKALDENLNIKISEQDLELARQDVRLVNSNYLPNASIGLNGAQVNEGSANEVFGRSERTLTEMIGVDQVIFSEDLSAKIKIQKYLEEGQKHATQQEINNVILRVYRSYFNILLIKSNLTVQQENLELLKKNLELAQQQRNIGSTNSSDVYRWESEVARATQNIIETQTQLILARSALNVQLNNSLEDLFRIDDIDLNDEIFNFYQNHFIIQNLSGPSDVTTATDFLTAEAKLNYPPRQQLNANIYAIDRQLKSNKRSYYLPTLSFDFDQAEVLERGGVASIETPMSNFFNSTWSAGITLAYPLFDGNRRAINLERSKVQKDRLENQLSAFDNGLFLNIQSSTIDLVTSRSNIHFSEISSENSWSNFEIIQDFYRQGSATVVQLFDAQNAALEAKLRYNNSIYNFLLAFVSLENSIGFYSLLATTSEQNSYEVRFNEFKTQN